MPRAIRIMVSAFVLIIGLGCTAGCTHTLGVFADAVGKGQGAVTDTIVGADRAVAASLEGH